MTCIREEEDQQVSTLNQWQCLSGRHWVCPSHITSSSSRYIVPRTRTKLCNRAVSVTWPAIWNSLPQSVTQTVSSVLSIVFVSLRQDPDNVPHCRILSCDKAEWRLITATLCRWKCCFLADQLWFMTHIWKQRLSVEDIFVIVDVVQCPFDRCSIVLNYLLTNVVLTDNCEWLLCVVSYSPNTVQNREVAISMMHRNDWNLSIIWNILCVNVHVTCARKHPLLTVECCYYAECGQCIQAKPEVSKITLSVDNVFQPNLRYRCGSDFSIFAVTALKVTADSVWYICKIADCIVFKRLTLR